MKNKDLIAKLQEYNPEAIVEITDFEGMPIDGAFDDICYGSSEGVTKENCDCITIFPPGLRFESA